MLSSLSLASCLLLGGPAPAKSFDPPAYLRAPDSSYSWREERSAPFLDGTVTLIHLTSQTWRDIPWQHWLAVVRPREVRHAGHALLIVGGGRKRESPPQRFPREMAVLAGIAEKTGTVVALLSQVPYQPLFEGLSEDALISFTFEKFLQTGDETWPLLLPMTKSAMRAMDAVQAFLKENHGQEVKRFTVTGASKRGWTTWLTGAADPRVAAIAPMVIDTLNMARQMPHQISCWGRYSEQIKDYTDRGLPDRLGAPGSRRLLELVDPYHWRARLEIPKLILIGTNDRYWPVDAVKHYFDDLPGEKYIHYVPNAGHDLGNGMGAVQAISAFYQSVVAGEPRPAFSWKREEDGGAVTVTVTTPRGGGDGDSLPSRAELWQAVSKDRDFRDEHWSATEVKPQAGRYVLRLPRPESGFTAFYGALTYRSSLGHDYSLATNVEVVGSRPAGETPAAQDP